MPSAKQTEVRVIGILLVSALILLAAAGVALAETVTSNAVRVYVRPVVSCAPSVSQAQINQPVTWQITAVHPSTGAFYSYSWSGTDNLSGGGLSREKSYATAGEKSVSVTATPAGIDPPPESLSRTVSCGAVTITGQPDLTANVPVLSGLKSVRPDMYEQGTATLTGAVNNTGVGEVSASFTNKYYWGLSAGGTFYSFTDPQTLADREFPLADPVSPLTPNKSTDPNRGLNRAVAPHTWQIGTGTWYFKVCADRPGTVTELNEENNCSPALGPIQIGVVTIIKRHLLTVETVFLRSARGEVSTAPPGISCGTQGTRCANLFNEGTEVSLTAAPDGTIGSRLVGWEVVGKQGICTDAGAACRITLGPETEETLVRATFTRGGGGGRRTGDPPDGICFASPSEVRVGNPVTWTVEPYEEGTPPYTIKWIGDKELLAACENAKPKATCSPPDAAPLNYGAPYSIDVSYDTTGKKSGTVRITDNKPQSVEISCSTEVVVTPKDSVTTPTPGFTLFADPPIITLYFSNADRNTRRTVASAPTRLYIIPSGNYNGTAKVSTIKLTGGAPEALGETEIKDVLTGAKTLRVPLVPTSVDVKLNLRSARDINRSFSNEFPPAHGADAITAKPKGLDFTMEATPDIPVGNYRVTFTAVGSPESSADVVVRVEKEGEPPPPPPDVTGTPPQKEPALPRFEEF